MQQNARSRGWRLTMVGAVAENDGGCRRRKLAKFNVLSMIRHTNTRERVHQKNGRHGIIVQSEISGAIALTNREIAGT